MVLAIPLSIWALVFPWPAEKRKDEGMERGKIVAGAQDLFGEGREDRGVDEKLWLKPACFPDKNTAAVVLFWKGEWIEDKVRRKRMAWDFFAEKNRESEGNNKRRMRARPLQQDFGRATIKE